LFILISYFSFEYTAKRPSSTDFYMNFINYELYELYELFEATKKVHILLIFARFDFKVVTRLKN